MHLSGFILCCQTAVLTGTCRRSSTKVYLEAFLSVAHQKRYCVFLPAVQDSDLKTARGWCAEGLSGQVIIAPMVAAPKVMLTTGAGSDVGVGSATCVKRFHSRPVLFPSVHDRLTGTRGTKLGKYRPFPLVHCTESDTVYWSSFRCRLLKSATHVDCYHSRPVLFSVSRFQDRRLGNLCEGFFAEAISWPLSVDFFFKPTMARTAVG